MTKTRAIIHLGPIKTGTTALSRYFTLTNQKGLTPKHIVFPSGDLWFGEDGEIVRQRRRLEALMEPRVHHLGNAANAAKPGSELDQGVAKVAAALRKAKVPVATAIFVVETGLPRFNPAILNNFLKRHFDEVTYLFMARRQDKLVTSILAQNMKMWEHRWVTLNPRIELAKRPALRDFAALNYAKQWRRWADVVGAENLLVVPYLEGEQGSFGTIDRIFEFAGLGKAPRVEGIEGKRIHPTFSVQGMNRLAHIKSIGRWAWFFPPFRKRLTEVWQTSIAAYHGGAIEGIKDPDGTPFVPWSLSDSDRRFVMRKFLGANRTLRALQNNHPTLWDSWLKETVEAAK